MAEQQDRERRLALSMPDLGQLVDALRYGPPEAKLVLVALAIAIIVPLVVLGSARTRAAHQHQQAVADQSQIAQLQGPLAEGRRVLEQATKYQKEEEILSTALPPQSNVVSIISTVFGLAAVDGVQVQSLSQSAPTTGTSGAVGTSASGATGATVEATMTAIGPPAAIERFVDDMRHAPRFMTVAQLSLNFSTGGIASAPLVFTAYTGQTPPPIR